MGSNSLVVVSPVRFLFEVTGVGRVVDDPGDCARILLDHAKTLVIANET